MDLLKSFFLGGAFSDEEARRTPGTIIYNYPHCFYIFSTLKRRHYSKVACLVGIYRFIYYFLAQAESLATVIPTFPVIDMAGCTGSTLWLLRIILTGAKFIKVGRNNNQV